MGLHGFWMNVYIAAIRAGDTSGNARLKANQAVTDFKELGIDTL